MKPIPTIIPILFILGLLACQPGESPMGQQCDFDLAGMHTHLSEAILLPAYSGLHTETDSLLESVNRFVAAPDEERLTALQTQWLTAYLAYQQASFFDFGPATDQGFDLSERLNTWPANPAGIQLAIEAQVSDASNRFKSEVGFPAMEYLLFGELGSSEGEVLATFTDAPDAAARRIYLQALATDLEAKASSVLAEWQAYQAGFAANTGNEAGSSLSLMVNALNLEYETFKNFKFKLPLGKLDGGTVQSQKVEGLYSGRSVELALTQAKAMRDFYLGKALNGGQDGLGFDDYLRCLKTGEDTPDGLLADAIVAQFAEIISSLEGLPDPLRETLEVDKPAVDAAYLLQQEMVPLLKREMVSAFGVRISYVDNDGD